MSTLTTFLSILKADPADLVDIINQIHDGWDTIDAKVDGSVARDLNFTNIGHSSVASTMTNISTSPTGRTKEYVVDDVIHLHGRAAITGAATGTISMLLPQACIHAANHAIGFASAFDASAGTVTPGVVLTSATSTQVNFGGGGGVLWNATSPFTWANGDFLAFHLWYEG